MLRRLGRAALSAMFVVGGAAAASEPGYRVGAAAQLGVPQPELAVRAGGGVMVVAGAMLALGVRPRLAAAVLAALLVPTTSRGTRSGGGRAPTGSSSRPTCSRTSGCSAASSA